MAHERDRAYPFNRVYNGSQSLEPSRLPPPSAAGCGQLRAHEHSGQPIPLYKVPQKVPAEQAAFLLNMIGSIHYRGVSAVHAVNSTDDLANSHLPLVSLSSPSVLDNSRL